MQRASAAFGLLIFVLWLAVLAVGLAYVTVWAATRRRPQWRILSWLTPKDAVGASPLRPVPPKHDPPDHDPTKPGPAKRDPASSAPPATGGIVIPFERHAAERRRKRA